MPSGCEQHVLVHISGKVIFRSALLASAGILERVARTEEAVLGVKRAAQRKLDHELGIKASQVRLRLQILDTDPL